MEGAGILTIAAAVLVLPFVLFRRLVIGPYRLVMSLRNNHSAKGPREQALAEASYGAAMIVFPVLLLMRYGAILPAWSPLAALALMIWGGFSLYNGVKFSVGWRDPKLIVRAALKIALAVWLFHAIGARQFDPVLNAPLSFVGWWLLVTGTTKLLLVLRGFPSFTTEVPQWSHGKAPFASPDDAAKGLSK
jgi:hypothetical protein